MPRKYIEGDVDVSKLMLTELPDFLADVAVRGSFNCKNNRLTSLKGTQLSVTENYFCDNNKKLAPAKMALTSSEIMRVFHTLFHINSTQSIRL